MVSLLEGRVAAVTGAGNGIGRAVAMALASHGARVVVNDYGGRADGVGSSTAAADRVVEEIRSMGADAVADHGNVALMSTGENIVNTAVKKWGRLDIMCCFAGILRAAPVWEMTEDQWDQVVAVQLKGSFTCARYASALMRDQKYGRLIFCSSEAGMGGSGSAWEANYSAAKAGIYGLTLSCALELREYNITSNCILPRAATRMNQEYPTSKEAAARGVGVRVEEQQATGTLRDPANVTPVCIYLASEEGGWVSGCAFWAWSHQLTLMARPHTQRSLYSDGPWDIDKLFSSFKETFGEDVQPVPIAKDGSRVLLMGVDPELQRFADRVSGRPTDGGWVESEAS